MNKQEKVTAKIKELGEAVKEANGGCIVIGYIETGHNDDTAVIASLQGRSKTLTDAIAKMLSQDSTKQVRSIIENGLAFANVYKLTGYGKADAEVVETHEL